ncbi:hypothetical protein QTP86_007050 [Hemibagrus guttatus]|nr:hypothetical protein QTP86_007050 [Hemibagrus guttatus]
MSSSSSLVKLIKFEKQKTGKTNKNRTNTGELHTEAAICSKGWLCTMTTRGDLNVVFYEFSAAWESHNKGAPGSKQYLVHWIVEAITQTYESYGVASPLGIRANTTRGNGPGPVPLHCLHCRLDMFSSASCHLQKFSDDSANVGLVTDDSDREYRDLIQDFVDWCQWNCLQINAVKTKELVVDFHRHEHPSPPPVNIQGKNIERVDSYKYLGVHLNNKLDWTDNTDAI